MAAPLRKSSWGICAQIWRTGCRPDNLIRKFLNLVVAASILAIQFRTLAQIRLIGFAGLPTLLISALAIGRLTSCKGNEDRKSLAFAASLRNVGVGSIIAAGLFPVHPLFLRVAVRDYRSFRIAVACYYGAGKRLRKLGGATL
jgi:hypothetical protein